MCNIHIKQCIIIISMINLIIQLYYLNCYLNNNNSNNAIFDLLCIMIIRYIIIIVIFINTFIYLKAAILAKQYSNTWLCSTTEILFTSCS